MSAWRREARRLLVALAVAHEAATDPPEAERGLLDLSDALRPTDPGGWAGVLEILLDGSLAGDLRAHVDPTVLILLEILFQEQVPAQPPFGLFTPVRGVSPAWLGALRALEERDRATGEQRAFRIVRLQHGDLPLSPDERLLLEQVRQRLSAGQAGASLGVVLIRRAATAQDQDGSYLPTSMPISGAEGWELDVELSRGRRDWMIKASRRWAGAGDAPAASAVHFRVSNALGGTLTEAELPESQSTLVTYVAELPRELHLTALALPENR